MSVSTLAEVSMQNGMRQLDLISHNLANANTNGFKADSLVQAFGNAMASAGVDVGRLNNDGAESFHLTDFSQGALRKTGNPLDVAIDGPGFFQVMAPGETQLSRAGSFSIDAQGRLVNSQGYPIRGVDGEIFLSGGEITIAADGIVRENDEYVGQLQLMEYGDVDALVKRGHGGYVAPDGVAGYPAEHSGVRQGFVEASNVDVMSEMISMMSTVRQFEMSSNVLKGYDEIMNSAISSIAEF